MQRNGIRGIGSIAQRWTCRRHVPSTSYLDGQLLYKRRLNLSPFTPPSEWKDPNYLDGRRYKRGI